MPEASEYVSLEEASELLGKSPDEFKALVEAKGLRSFRDGEAIKFRRSEVMGMMESKLNIEGGEFDEALKSDDDFLLFTEEDKTAGSETLELSPDETAPSGPQAAPTISMGNRGPDSKLETRAESKSETKSDTQSDADASDTRDEVKGDTKMETEATEIGRETSEELDLGEDFFELEPMDEEEDTGTAGVFDQLDIIEEEEESGSTDEVTGQLVAEEGDSGEEEPILEGAEALEEGEEITPEAAAAMGARFDVGLGAAKGAAASVNPVFPVLLVLGAIAAVWALLMAVNQLIPNSGLQGINQILVNVFKKG